MTAPMDDFLAALYAERFARHPEYKPAERQRSVGDYPPVTEQDALRHRREAVEAFYPQRTKEIE